MGTSKRTYLGTHPWLTFRLDPREAPYDLWILLGEARSKMQHLGESLLAPETGAQLRALYLAKGVHATTAIEGNTLSEEEVMEHLAGRLKLPHSQAYRAREIDNIVTAYNQITTELAEDGSRNLSVEKIERYNRLILDGLEVEEGVAPGELGGETAGRGSLSCSTARGLRLSAGATVRVVGQPRLRSAKR